MVKRILKHLDPETLRDHDLSIEIYRDQPDQELLESIKAVGIQQPIILASDEATIVAGHRRKNAARKLGLKEVPCVIRTDLSDDLEIRQAVIESNRQREKTVEQKAREFKALRKIEEELAAQRQKQGLKQNQSTVVANLPQRENLGKSRDFAAEKVGMSPRTAEKAAAVVDEIDAAQKEGDEARAEELRGDLNKSVDSAHKKVKKTKPKVKEISPAKLVDELTLKHVSPLVRGIDAVAVANGGKGHFHKNANGALNDLAAALKKMREGKQ